MQKSIHFDKFLILSSLILAFLLYTGAVTLRYASVKYPVSVKKTSCMEVELNGDPVKAYRGRYYRQKARLISYYNNINGFSVKTFCKCAVELLIPSESVEALLPRRLNSLNDRAVDDDEVLFDKGQHLLLNGKWSTKEDSFILSSYKTLPVKDTFTLKLYKTRSSIRLMLKRILSSWADAGSLVMALFMGTKEYLEDDIVQSFRNSGCSHVLALSGMHLSLIMMLPLSLFGFIVGRKSSKALSFIFVVFFVFIAGFTPSLLRAFLMLSIVYLCRLFYTSKYNNFSLLCGVFILHVIFFPSDFNTLSFNLSYASIAGIMLLSPYLEGYTTKYFSSSIGAFVATSPITIKCFGAVYPVAVVSSLVVSALITVFMYSALFCLLFSFIMPFLLVPFGYIMKAQYAFLMAVINFFGKIPAVYFY